MDFNVKHFKTSLLLLVKINSDNGLLYISLP
jgi:hypothetical protein